MQTNSTESRMPRPRRRIARAAEQCLDLQLPANQQRRDEARDVPEQIMLQKWLGLQVVRAPHFKEMWPAIEIRPTEF
jgi:hypothetical protein